MTESEEMEKHRNQSRRNLNTLSIMSSAVAAAPSSSMTAGLSKDYRTKLRRRRARSHAPQSRRWIAEEDSRQAVRKKMELSQWGGLRYFMLRAVPRPKSKNTKHGGAYISCWVNYPHEEGALVLAKHYIKSEGWQCRAVNEKKWVRRSDYEGDESLRYYEEAANDGSSFVFHVYPRVRRSNPTKRSTRPAKTQAR
jgi:hypothetical protein